MHNSMVRLPTALIPVAACLTGWLAALAGPIDIHVAPNGSDTNVGTERAPFATLGGARRAARAVIAKGLTGDLTVHVHAGTYLLEEPFVLGPQDGGTERYAVRYVARGDAKPVLSGGRRITGWRKGAAGVWVVTLPEAKSGSWTFRQLFVAGRRAVRARTPNVSAEEYCFRLQGASIAKDLSRHTLVLLPEQVRQWRNLGDVEAVVLKNWANLRKRVESVEPETGVVVLRPPHVEYFGGNKPRKGCGCFLENSPDFLDEPGEWYLDRTTGLLSYWPLAGQDMPTTQVFAPVLTHLLAVEGTRDDPVRNLHVEGLAFSHTDMPLPEAGHHG